MEKYSVEEMIMRHAVDTPDKLAIAAMNGELTYAELAEMMKRAACFLKSVGVKKSDRVILYAIPKKEYFIFYFALHLIGGICVPIAINTRRELLKHIIESTGAEYILADENAVENNYISYDSINTFQESGNEENDIVEMSDIADIIYTTGTTGLAKGVALTHDNLEAGTHNIINAVGMAENEIILAPLPLNHSNALGTMRAFMYRGATLVVHDGFTNIKNMEERINKYHCTAFSGAPSALTILERVTKRHIERILKDMHYIEIGTAPMDMELKKRVMEALPDTKLLINYGATEAHRAVYMDLNSHPDKLKSIGKPVKNMSVKIINEKNEEIRSSRENFGRLVICGRTCMKGYWNEPELSKEVLVAGGLATSDLAYIDDDGFIFLVGRANDVINIGGKKVSPFEIEDALLTNEKVAECACIPVEDKNGILGNVPVMFVVLQKDSEVIPNELRQYLLAKLDTYKVPVEFILVDQLPRNYVGKLDRKELKNMWENR